MLGGGILIGLAMATVYGVLPFARRWAAREDAIAATREQRARLQSLVASEAQLRKVLAQQRHARVIRSRRLLTGATPAVAASSLQALIQRYAEESSVTLDRVDVVGEEAEPDSGLAAIPMELSAQGDIYGFVALLYRLQHGEKLLVVDEVIANGASFDDGTSLDGDGAPLTWSIRLRAPYLAREST
jgi:hypothetical protein